MTGQEKLQEYNEALQEANKAQARVNVVENELRQMVHSFLRIAEAVGILIA
jgi:hypothetical protein